MTGYRPDVDGLRAVAVAAVVIFHAFPTLLPGGFVGVDVFFVISGYLIGGIIMNGLDKGRFTFADFYLRRIRRIFPALIVVLAAVYAVGRFVLLPDEFAQLGRDTVASVFFVQNFNLWSQAGYFDNATYEKPLLHIWSLAVEEQFYIVYPLLIAMLWRWRATTLWILIALTITSFAANIASVETQRTMTFYFPHTRIWEILLGVVLARTEMMRGGRETGPAIAAACNIAGFALIAFAVTFTREDMAFPGWIGLAPTIGAALLILAGPSAPLNRAVLANPIMVGIGLISYPLYLWHWPLLSYARILEGQNLSLPIALVCIAMSVVLAAITYLAIERPIRLRPVSRRVAAVAATLLLTVGGAGGLAAASASPAVSASGAPTLEAALAEWGGNRQDRPGCRQRFAPAMGPRAYCADSGRGSPDVLVMGDSHANTIFYGLEPLLVQRGRNPAMIGYGGCPPLVDTAVYLGGEPDQCRDMIPRQLAYAINTPSVQTIILSGRWALYESAWGFSTDDRGEGRVLEFRNMRAVDPNNRASGQWRIGQPARFRAAFLATIEMLAASGKEIIVLYDWPEHREKARDCLGIRPGQQTVSGERAAACVIATADVMERQAGYRAIFEEAQRAYPDVTFIDPVPALCAAHCEILTDDGTLLYLDDDHLSIYGSDLAARFIVRRMR